MPRKKRQCLEEGCNTLTHGNKCVKHSYADRKLNDDIAVYKHFHSIKRKYGVTEEEYYIYWVAFKGKCGICNIDMIFPLKQRGQPNNIVTVDHDHLTGKFRGLLCSACNKGLGHFKDNVQNLKNAIKWLEQCEN